MSQATMHLVPNIFTPTLAFDFSIIPERLVWNNLASVPLLSTGWNYYPGVQVWDEVNYYTYDHAWGTSVDPTVGGTDPNWSPQLGDLTFIFKNAAFHPTSSTFYNFKVEIIGAYAYNGDDHARDVIMIGLSDDNTSNTPGFWIQSYLAVTPSSVSAAAGTATVRLSVVDNFGVEIAGKFLYPFTDIDVVYDATTGSTTPLDPNTYYSESIEILSGCSDIYAKSGTGSTGSWLQLRSGTDSVDVSVQNTDGHTYQYSNLKDYGLRFDSNTGTDDTDPMLGRTGIVGLYDTGSTVIWRGSRCGTSLRGEGITFHTITFNLQNGYAIQQDLISPGPLTYLIAEGTGYNVSNYRFERLGYHMLGWATSSTATTPDYPTNYTFIVNTDMVLYAVWQIQTHLVRFHDSYTPGNDVIAQETVTHGQNVPVASIPVPGQTYSGRKFQQPGFYYFSGWAGSLTNITDDTDVFAMWDFSPIWVMKNGNWVKYDPTES